MSNRNEVRLDFYRSELPSATNYLRKLVPFLTKDLCGRCSDRVSKCAISLENERSKLEIISDSSLTHPQINKESNKQPLELECDPADVGRKAENKPELLREQREHHRFMLVQRKKDFICLETVNGKSVNILDGLELHTRVFSAAEQHKIVALVHDLQEKGIKGELREREYTAPHEKLQGNQPATIQLGCCYNYAQDKEGNPPGILREKMVDPVHGLFKIMVRRLVEWHVLSPSCVPDSCVINIFGKGDFIPPHRDHHDFLRPICTVSFLSECNMLFGTKIKTVAPGNFAGSTSIPLPVGSVLVIDGNGADVAKHCVPAVPRERISITFRKMDVAKHPFGFTPALDLQGIKPLPYVPNESKSSTPSKSPIAEQRQPVTSVGNLERRQFLSGGRPSEFRGGNSDRRELFGRGSHSERTSDERVIHGRGSHSEIREGISDRRVILGRGSDSEIREGNSDRRVILGRGNHSEIREGNSDRRGILEGWNQTDIREGDSDRRGIPGRRNQSEIRDGNSERRGFLWREG